MKTKHLIRINENNNIITNDFRIMNRLRCNDVNSTFSAFKTIEVNSNDVIDAVFDFTKKHKLLYITELKKKRTPEFTFIDFFLNHCCEIHALHIAKAFSINHATVLYNKNVIFNEFSLLKSRNKSSRFDALQNEYTELIRVAFC